MLFFELTNLGRDFPESIHTQLLKKAREEKEAAKNPPVGEPPREGATT